MNTGICTYSHRRHRFRSLIRRRNDNLEQQAQALFKAWFVDFEPFKDGKFVESEMGMIPEGWRLVELRDIVSISKKTITPLKHPDTLFHHYSLPAFDNGMVPEIQKGSEILSNKFLLETNITLFSKLNPRIKRIWFTSKVPSNSVCSTEFLPYKSVCESQYAFIYALLNSDEFYASVMSYVNGATGSHQRFHAEDTLNYVLPYNETAVEEFVKRMNPILEEQCSLRNEIIHLVALRDTLLPKLMSGELTISSSNK